MRWPGLLLCDGAAWLVICGGAVVGDGLQPNDSARARAGWNDAQAHGIFWARLGRQIARSTPNHVELVSAFSAQTL